MLHIKETIVVEGKYDREILRRICDAPIICTGGFDLYKNKATIAAIRKMAEKTGIIVLTDSDSAGFRIRSYIGQCVGGRGTVRHAYIPTVKGKEHRKERAGREGLLGVEGMDEETLCEILKCAAEVTDAPPSAHLTKADFYADGLTGRPDSALRRRMLAQRLGLPLRISANAMLEIINRAYGGDEYRKALNFVNINIDNGINKV